MQTANGTAPAHVLRLERINTCWGSVESNWLIGGVPARPIRQLRTEDYELIFAKTRPDLPDQALEDERNPFYKPVADSLAGS